MNPHRLKLDLLLKSIEQCPRMVDHVLDNPTWASLTSRHRALALRHGDVARYPAELTPFLAMAAGQRGRSSARHTGGAK